MQYKNGSDNGNMISMQEELISLLSYIYYMLLYLYNYVNQVIVS